MKPIRLCLRRIGLEMALLSLLALCVVMTVASLAVGNLPLFFTLTDETAHILHTLGAGVLVGSSLGIIIPEGIETLYTSGANHVAEVTEKGHSRRWSLPQRLEPTLWSTDPSADLSQALIARSETKVIPSENELSTPASQKVAADTETLPHEDEHDHGSSPHASIGIALICGFMLMYLVDRLPKDISASFSRKSKYHVAVDTMNLRALPTTNGPDQEDEGAQSPTGRNASTTVGLLIHATADGIALGASSATSNVALEAIVFFAIMLHKAPAAFALSSVLLSSGYSKRQIRQRIFMFSIAAPVGAVMTWLAVYILGGGSYIDTERMKFWTGFLLIFSGGTFLYVAMHVMQDPTHRVEEGKEGHTDASRHREGSLRDTLIFCCGMSLPFLLAMLGGHGH